MKAAKRVVAMITISCFLCACKQEERTMNSHEIVTALVKAVNLHDTALMEQLIHADFMVEDATGPVKNGREEFLAYWKQEFALFPSYSIELSEIFGDKNVLLATLVSQHAKASSGDATPSHPQKVTWRLEVLDNKISHWREYIASYPVQDSHAEMEKQGISGLGGVFFKSKDPKALSAWYDEHLGMHFGKENNHSFKWRERFAPGQIGRTEFAIFNENSDYYAPSTKPFMFNLRVQDLDTLLDQLKKEGVTMAGEPESFDYGKFAWILDPEGNKIELWQPVDEILEAYDTTIGK